MDVHIAETAFAISAVSAKFLDRVSELVSHLEEAFPGQVWYAHLREIA